MPFLLTPKQSGGNVGHQILVARNVKCCEWTDFQNVEAQCKDPDELLRHKAGSGHHVLHPADSWAIVAEESGPLLSEGATYMLHH